MDVSLFSDTVCFCIYFFLEEGIIFVEYTFVVVVVVVVVVM